MQRLLKFSCHQCGAKLAVPLQMAGLSDNCPKCGALVTSPALPAEPTPTPALPAAAQEGFSAEQLADALRPPPPRPQPVEPRPAPTPPPAAPAPMPTTQAPSPVAEAALPPSPTAPVPSVTTAKEARPFPPAPEAGVSAPVPETRSTRPAPTEPDLFGTSLPFPPAPQLPGQVPEPPAMAQQAPPAPASRESDGKAPAAEPTSAAPTGRPATSRGQESRLRSKLQSLSRPVEGEDAGKNPSSASGAKASRAPDGKEKTPLQEAPSALMPATLPDEETAKEAAKPGMGEMLSVGSAPMSAPHLAPPDARPWLHVPLVTVGNSPSRDRRLRLNRVALIGVVTFLLVDLLVVLWFCRKPIAAWLATSPPPAQTAQKSPVAPTPGMATAEDTSASSPAAAIPPVTNPGTPPADTEATAPAPREEAVVPMAIPITEIPGDAATVPTATPVPAPPPVEAPALPEASPAPAMAASPLPEPAPADPTESLPTPSPSPLAASPPPAPPPLPSTLPGGLEEAPAAAFVDAKGNPLPYGGLPPPPADMALPNGPIPDISGPAVTLVTTPTPEPKVGRVPKEAQSAVDVLKNFLAAPSWRDRLPLVQKADALRAALERDPGLFKDGPIRATQIDFVDRYTTKGNVPPYCMFEISGGTLEHPVLALVEQSTKNGVRVDWEAFIDFKEDLLLKFLEKKGAPNAKFRVMLRRKHYFDKDVPDVSSKDAFEVKQPHGHFQGHIFLPKKSTLAQQLANQLGWSMDMPVIAELAWRTDGKHHWVELVSISSYGWRG